MVYRTVWFEKPPFHAGGMHLCDGSQLRAELETQEVVVSEWGEPHIAAHVYQARPRDVVHSQLVLKRRR